MDIKIDSGAEADLLSEKDFKKVMPKFQLQAKLRLPKERLTAYGGHTIPVLGKCFLRCRNMKGQEEILEYHVVKEHKSLLGCQGSKKLKFITFNVDGVCKGITEDPDALTGLTNQEIFQGYKSIFEGIGCIAEPYHIKVQEGAVPVVHAPRKIPASLREKVQDELSNMEKKGIIKKVEEPTSWANSMVFNEKKSGKLRICIDPRDLNKVIEREPYQLPTQREIASTGCLKKKYPLLTGNRNETIRYYYPVNGQLNSSVFNLDSHTLHSKIAHQTLEIQACKVKIYSASETRGFEKGPSHDLFHGYFPKHL